MIRKIRVVYTTHHYERKPGCWVIYLIHDPSFEYGTRLVLYDDGRSVLEVHRPDDLDIVELSHEKS
jgi:hypothetical protein